MIDILKQAWIQAGAIGLLFAGLIYDRLNLQKRIRTLEAREDTRSERVLKALEGAESALNTQNAVLQDIRGSLVNLGQTVLSFYRVRDTP